MASASSVTGNAPSAASRSTALANGTSVSSSPRNRIGQPAATSMCGGGTFLASIGAAGLRRVVGRLVGREKTDRLPAASHRRAETTARMATVELFHVSRRSRGSGPEEAEGLPVAAGTSTVADGGSVEAVDGSAGGRAATSWGFSGFGDFGNRSATVAATAVAGGSVSIAAGSGFGRENNSQTSSKLAVSVASGATPREAISGRAARRQKCVPRIRSPGSEESPPRDPAAAGQPGRGTRGFGLAEG